MSFDRTEAEKLLLAWDEVATHNEPRFLLWLLTLEMAHRHRNGTLGPLADLIIERAERKIDSQMRKGDGIEPS